jgi:hypothetical protein
MKTVFIEGAKAKVKKSLNILLAVGLVSGAIFMAGCETGGGMATGGSTGSGEVAATVNGKSIMMEEVEKVIKANYRGQETKLSQLELTQARLQVLEQLIQQEVMFQKAEKEGTVPTDDDVTQEINKLKNSSGVSAEEFEKKLKEAGESEAGLKDKMKRELAVKKLVDKVTNAVTPPKDKEIEDFFSSNKEQFKKRRGVKLASIVIDPADSGEGDTTKNQAEAINKAKEIMEELGQDSSRFADVAREKSEDANRLQGGEMGYLSEEDLKQNLSPQYAQAFMAENFKIGGITPPLNVAGKFYIFKLQERILKDEDQNLDSPGVKQQITDLLIGSRKQLLSTSYAATSMNEARIDNLLAKKVIANPNELSGTRPVDTSSPAVSPAASASPVEGKEGDKKAEDKKDDEKKEEAKPAAANAAANAPAANAEANKK